MPDEHSGPNQPGKLNSPAVADGVDVGSGTATVATPVFARGKQVSATGRPAILDFMTNTIAGYDATHQNPAPERPLLAAATPVAATESYKLKTCPYLGDISSALNGHDKPYPDDLNDEQSALAKQITDAAIAYKAIMDETFDASNFVERMTRSESANAALKQTVKAVPSELLNVVLAASNLDLEMHGLRIARVAANGEIWMGNLGENNRFSPAMRLRGTHKN